MFVSLKQKHKKIGLKESFKPLLEAIVAVCRVRMARGRLFQSKGAVLRARKLCRLDYRATRVAHPAERVNRAVRYDATRPC